MSKDGIALNVVVVLLIFLGYMSWVGSNINKKQFDNGPGILPKPEVNSNYELPELNETEEAEVDSLIKKNIKEAENESDKKSIESMRDEVVKILDEVVEEDSTVTISFNMQWTPSWVD